MFEVQIISISKMDISLLLNMLSLVGEYIVHQTRKQNENNKKYSKN